MKVHRAIIEPSHANSRHSDAPRPGKKLVAVTLASLVCCASVGPTACTSGLQPSKLNIGPSGGQIAAVAVGVGAVVVGTVVLIEVNHSHHTLKGCVFSGPNGLEVQTQDDAKTYALAGETANLKVGDLVKFHGTKLKKVKGSAGDRTFTVEKISKDYGPCKLSSGQPAGAANGR